jgi:hypothetical protein
VQAVPVSEKLFRRIALEATFTTGIVEPAALPGVRIDLDALFAASNS